MNVYSIALIFLAWQLIKQNGRQNGGGFPKDILSENAQNVVDAVQNLTNGGSKTDALLSLLTNPAVSEILSQFLTKSDVKNDAPKQSTAPNVNDEGYVFKDRPSADSQSFFSPVDNIADDEVKHKLYRFYDNWYVK